MWLDLKCRSVYFKINWSTSCATVWWGSRSSFLISLSPEEIFIGHSKSWIPLGETEKNIFSWTVAEVKCSACSSSTPTILVQIQLNCLKWTKWTKKRPRMVWFKNALFKMKDQTKGWSFYETTDPTRRWYSCGRCTIIPVSNSTNCSP